jgi:hypothetical protein
VTPVVAATAHLARNIDKSDIPRREKAKACLMGDSVPKLERIFGRMQDEKSLCGGLFRGNGRNHVCYGIDPTAMNSLYTLGLRQTSAIQADLERLRNGDVSVSLLGGQTCLTMAAAHNAYNACTSTRLSSLGQISASLAALNRTVDDYDSMAKREMIKAKQEKAFMCVWHDFSRIFAASLDEA